MNPNYPPREEPPPGEFPEWGQGPPPPSPRQVVLNYPAVAPIVTYTLLGITILIFILQLVSESYLGIDLPSAWGMKINELILSGEYWRLITPMFLHGSILHIGFNMYALYMFGPGLERHYGHWRFVLLYFLAGFAGNVMSFLFSSSPSLGSSTAIFGLLGAEGVFLYQNQKILGRNAQRALGNLLTLAVVNLLLGLAPQIDNWGHIGGLLGGVLFAWAAGPKLKVDGFYPNLTVVDERETGEVIRAGISVSLLFLLITVTTIFIRR